MLTALLPPAQLPAAPAALARLTPGTERARGHSRSCQTAPELPAQRRLFLTSQHFVTRLLCSDNSSDDQSRPRARSLPNLLPPHRSAGAAPARAHRSAPCFSLHLHPHLPRASTADLQQPRCRARASPALISTQQRHTLTQEGNGDEVAPAAAPNLAKQQLLCIGAVSHHPLQSAGRGTLSPAAQHQNPSLVALWGVPSAGGLQALVPMVLLTQPKRSRELSCGRAWLPFCLGMQFIASVLPSMHQFLIQIQTQVKVSPVI